MEILIRRLIRPAAAALLMVAAMTLLSGCWDNRELDTLFIVTGMALDKAPDPGMTDVTLQIGKTKSTAQPQSSGESDAQSSSTILFSASGGTPLQAIFKLNFSSSRSLFFEHNQVVVFGSELAREGIKGCMDLFLRNDEARMEVPLFVAEGSAGEILAANAEQEQSSGIYLARVMQDLAQVSLYYRVRMLDFISRMREEGSAPVAPIVRVNGGEDEDGGNKKQKLEICGMAVFKDGRMIGCLESRDVQGYILAMGAVKLSGVIASGDKGRAVFNAINLDTKKDVELRPDGGVRVKLSVAGTMGIGEIQGFNGMSVPELMPELTTMAENQIKNQVTETFDKAKALKADIYEIGSAVHRRYPKQWEDMKSDWDNLFPDIELEVEVKVKIPETGKTVKSLEMEERADENR